MSAMLGEGEGLGDGDAVATVICDAVKEVEHVPEPDAVIVTPTTTAALFGTKTVCAFQETCMEPHFVPVTR